MPLGLLPGMAYEEREVLLAPHDTVLFYSDGLVEAHNPERAMFGFPRLQSLIAAHAGGAALIDFLLAQLNDFTGADWEQEDDATLVTLQRDATTLAHGESAWQTLIEFSVRSETGNERDVMQRVAQALQDTLPASRMEKLKTAVAEATMNAIEHGNQNRPELPVDVKVSTAPDAVRVCITDRGSATEIPESTSPDLDAKLAGLQTPRGWGLFLIKNMVDEMNIFGDDAHHTLELIVRLKGEQDGAANS
jgi:anti-sigma regulatory factor (Ser/Thr protein kinase)